MTGPDVVWALVSCSVFAAIAFALGYKLGYDNGFTGGYSCSQDRLDDAHRAEECPL